MDVGLLVIRVVIGATFVGHGAQKLFGAFGGAGLRATGAYMESLGFRPGRRYAEMAGVAELVCGALLVAGLLTPFACAGIIGVMLVAALAAAKPTFFHTAGGFEYPLVLGAIAAGLAFTGPGFVSLDRALDLDIHGPFWGPVGVLLGLCGGFAQMAMRHPPPDVDLRDDAAPHTRRPRLTRLTRSR